ncbi:polyphenol oxidase family protein [bacterium]|nr:polyphenol oxidase family protein [bacterium]
MNQLRYSKIFSAGGWIVEPWLAEGIHHGFLDKSYDLSRPRWEWEVLDYPQEFKNLQLLKQIHSSLVFCCESNPVPENSAGNSEPGAMPEGDGWYGLHPSPTKQILMGIKTADCIPVLLIDQSRKYRAALHCGWRSAAQQILTKTLKIFKQQNILPATIEIALGPGAQACCYEVGEEVFQEFSLSAHALGFDLHSQKIRVDTVNQSYLSVSNFLIAEAQAFGIKATNIYNTNVCTICDQRLFSFRREADASGRQLSFITNF